MNPMHFFLLYFISQNEVEFFQAGVIFVLAAYLYSTTIKTRNYITSAALQEPSLSSGMRLYHHGGDRDYISAMGIDRATFSYLLQSFSQYYVVHSGPGRRGRPVKLLEKGAVLACLLHFYAGTMEDKTLCVLFGVPPATLSRIMRNAEIALEKCLRRIPEASVSWPNFTTQQEWAARVYEKEPLLKGIWGFIDGKNYKVQIPSNSDLQNAMYNGNWML